MESENVERTLRWSNKPTCFILQMRRQRGKRLRLLPRDAHLVTTITAFKGQILYLATCSFFCFHRQWRHPIMWFYIPFSHSLECCVSFLLQMMRWLSSFFIPVPSWHEWHLGPQTLFYFFSFSSANIYKQRVTFVTFQHWGVLFTLYIPKKSSSGSAASTYEHEIKHIQRSSSVS